MRRWLKRLLLVVILFEAGYLLLINVALNLPLTQDLINRIKPDKFTVHWRRAWSWYPFRVHVRGIAVDGQSSSQQWQVDASAGSASIGLPALLGRTVQVYDVAGRDVVYHQRPRPRADRDYAGRSEHFPLIRNRDPNSAAPTSSAAARDDGGKPRRGWRIELGDLQASGRHEVWVYQLRIAFSGEATADLGYQTRGGPFSLGRGLADLQLQSLTLNGVPAIARPGPVTGSFGFAPFVPSEHKGIGALAFLQLDLELDQQVETLDFLDLYLSRFAGLEVDGAGAVRGRLRFGDGRIRPGSELAVEASELSVAALGHAAEGEGAVDLRVADERPDAVQVGIRFGALRGLHRTSGDLLFSGRGLTLAALGPTGLLAALDSSDTVGAPPVLSEVSASLPSVVVPDIAAYQRYLPPRWQLGLLGGRGELSAEAALTATRFDATLQLLSPGAEIGFKDFDFNTGIDLGLKLSSTALEQATVDASGSYLKLDGSVLGQEQRGDSEQWRSSLTVERGVLSLPLPAVGPEPDPETEPGPGFRELFRGNS